MIKKPRAIIAVAAKIVFAAFQCVSANSYASLADMEEKGIGELYIFAFLCWRGVYLQHAGGSLEGNESAITGRSETRWRISPG